MAVGPEDAASVRKTYLLDNGAYLEHNLRAVGASALTTTVFEVQCEEFREGLKAVDR